MRFFDAHCDTIGKIRVRNGDFTAETGMHVTLPGLRQAGVCAQVFASWAWSGAYAGREFEVGLEMVNAVRALCETHPDDLFLATTGRAAAGACADGARIAVIASLEGADPLMGNVDNLPVFHRAGVRLLTLAWSDNPFCGTVFGGRSGLTAKGFALVEACEELGIMVDVSHVSDAAFGDVRSVASKPFIASHSNCRSLCPNERNLTDDMIRTLGHCGGVMGINLGSGFLSPEFYARAKAVREEFFRSVNAGEKTFDEAGEISSVALGRIPRPPLELVVEHVRWAIAVGGEDCVGLGGDLDGVDSTPLGLDGVADYPRIAELLEKSGLSHSQVEKVCYGNFARVFREVLG
ncbi:MAG: membrane dipeptidase [Actinobacteria bacterium]|nr:membrane dipeptidase [Actinomycetota bacterium]